MFRHRQANLRVRTASEDDLGSINDIYNHYVIRAHFTFDVEPISIQARREWFSDMGCRLVREAPRLNLAESNACG